MHLPVFAADIADRYFVIAGFPHDPVKIHISQLCEDQIVHFIERVRTKSLLPSQVQIFIHCILRCHSEYPFRTILHIKCVESVYYTILSINDFAAKVSLQFSFYCCNRLYGVSEKPAASAQIKKTRPQPGLLITL